MNTLLFYRYWFNLIIILIDKIFRKRATTWYSLSKSVIPLNINGSTHWTHYYYLLVDMFIVPSFVLCCTFFQTHVKSSPNDEWRAYAFFTAAVKIFALIYWALQNKKNIFSINKTPFKLSQKKKQTKKFLQSLRYCQS